MNRREALQTGAALVAAAATAASASAAEPEGDYVDAHSHVWTSDTERFPLAGGFRREEMKPPSFTPEELMKHAAPAGVGRVVLIQMSFYGYDNRYLLDSISRYRGKFSGVAVVDERSENLKQKVEALRKAGVRGFRIYPTDQPVDHWLASDGMARLWKIAAEQHMAICPLINPDGLADLDRMCGDNPDTPVVIDHLSRLGMAGPASEADIAQLCKLAKHKHTHVKVSAFYALGKKAAPYTDLAPMIRRVVEAFGAQRCMWGSDCPFQVQAPYNYADSIALVRERLDFLRTVDRLWLLAKTAEKVFFS